MLLKFAYRYGRGTLMTWWKNCDLELLEAAPFLASKSCFKSTY